MMDKQFIEESDDIANADVTIVSSVEVIQKLLEQNQKSLHLLENQQR